MAGNLSQNSRVAKIRVGPTREKQIRRLLARAGWSLREVVDRKLPFTRLPAELKVPLWAGRLEPTRALLLNQVKNPLERAKLLNLGASSRTIQAAKPKRKKLSRATTAKKPDPQFETDFRTLELHHLQLERRAVTRGQGCRVHVKCFT